MAQWFFNPFAVSQVFGSHSTGDTIIQLQPGEGSRFSQAPAQLAIWDVTLWDDWVDAFFDTPSAVEIVHQLSAASGDALPSVLRAQGGTAALDMTDTRQRFRVQAVQTGFIVGADVKAGTLEVTVGPLTVEAGNAVINGGAWNSGHLVMGAYHFWVDASGRLRIKSGSPSSDTDGTVVGTQV